MAEKRHIKIESKMGFEQTSNEPKINNRPKIVTYLTKNIPKIACKLYLNNLKIGPRPKMDN